MIAYLLLSIFVCTKVYAGDFSPDTTDYEAYGAKIAFNDVIFVQAEGNEEQFLVQYAPYNYTFETLQCTFDYDDPTHYVYSVGVGQKQNTSSVYFYVAGEVVPEGMSDTDGSGRNGTFIGVWINRDPHGIRDYLTMRQPLSCDQFQISSLQFISSYDHQEFFVIAVEPYGTYALGLAKSFVFRYQPLPISMTTTKPSVQVWPNNFTFSPCAADASTTFTIVAGFAESATRSRVRATPAVYLLSNTNLTVLSTWSYSATNNSWQSRLTYSNVGSFDSKYTMSVKINSDDPTRVLVGMPFLNTVFLFTVTNGVTLTLASYVDNGQSVGFGKSVTWLTQSQAAILVSTYSINYLTWYSSTIYVYTSLNNTTLPSLPSAAIPNSQQPLPSTMNSKLIRIVSSPATLAVLDTAGGVLIIESEDSGYYASTDTTNSPVAAAMPVVSHSTTCIGGTFKSGPGIHPCQICPSGMRNSGGVNGSTCVNCSLNSFCPLGSVYDINSSILTSLSQAYAYPSSPDSTSFEDVLLLNMFKLNTTTSCLVVSPMFWTFILLILFLLLLIIMASFTWCVQPSKRERYRATIKGIFQRTDLVGEGELWTGGLASIIVVLISIMAYMFSISYMQQYPIEKAQGSKFACDTTLRNAKFESSLQALAVPVSSEEQVIFDMLNEQNFTLQFDFVNTALSCMAVTVYEVTDSSTTSLPLLSCSKVNGTVSTTVRLTDHDINLKVVASDIQLIGAIRIGISGVGLARSSYTLKDLNFLRAIYSPSVQTLAQAASVQIAMTKVINETDPLFGEDEEYGGIWYPTFTYSLSQMFITADQYATTANLTSTTITLAISETSYYIKNVQSPIAKEAEIVFRTLLFTFLCLEICAMAFLICKLLIGPFVQKIYARCTGQEKNAIAPLHGSTYKHSHS